MQFLKSKVIEREQKRGNITDWIIIAVEQIEALFGIKHFGVEE